MRQEIRSAVRCTRTILLLLLGRALQSQKYILDADLSWLNIETCESEVISGPDPHPTVPFGL